MIQDEVGGLWNANVPSVVIDGLMASTQYDFSVTAVDAAGNTSDRMLLTTAQTAEANALTEREIYEGMRPHCSGCHDAGSLSPYFGSLQDFQQLVVNDASLVTAGDAENSLFVRVLEGRGNAPWASMPLGGQNYAQSAQRGQTEITMEQIRAWISNMGANQ